MILEEVQSDKFYKLLWALYFYTNQKYPVINGLKGPNLFDEELLRHYLRSVKRKIEHEYEIQAILGKNPSLQSVYSMGLGKSYAKGARKRLHHHDASPAWFGVFEDLIAASGKNKEEARECAQAVLTREKWAGVHCFRHAGKVAK